MTIDKINNVYKLEGYLHNIISDEEIKGEKELFNNNINSENLELATFGDILNALNEDKDNGYMGEIRVQEGIFEFNFDTGEYEELKQ